MPTFDATAARSADAGSAKQSRPAPSDFEVGDGAARGVPSPVPVPRLEDYDISPKTGFLPEEEPLGRLEDPYFAPWENLVGSFNAYLLAGELRNAVRELPLLDHARLQNVRELRRAFLILCMLGHAYVWGKGEPPAHVLPAQLAVPWHHVAERLKLRPVTCQASVVLWNWRLLNPSKGLNLSNFAVLHTYSGSTDEAWFYLVTTAIEAQGASALTAIVKALHGSRQGDLEAVAAALEALEKVLMELNKLLKRMYDHCDPYVFYWRIRPYLAGWENMADGGLPNGVRYEGVEPAAASVAPGELPGYRKYAGGSAAQSSLIQAIDAGLGIEHRPTGQRPGNKPGLTDAMHLPRVGQGDSGEAKGRPNGQPQRQTDGSSITPEIGKSLTASGSPSGNTPKGGQHSNFIWKMRQYMPGPHAAFLEHLTKAATIRPFVQLVADPLSRDTSATPQIREQAESVVDLYDRCLHQVKLFRDKHIQIVTLYIVMQARRGPSVGSSHVAKTHASASYEVHEKTIKTVVSSPTTEQFHTVPDASSSGNAGVELNSAAQQGPIGGVSTAPLYSPTTVTTMTCSETTIVPLSPSHADAPAGRPPLALPPSLQNRRGSLRTTHSSSSIPALFVSSTAPEPVTGPRVSSQGLGKTAAQLAASETIRAVEVTKTDASGQIKVHSIGLAKHIDRGDVVVRGTGGTDLLPFLKQARDEVIDCKVADFT